MTKKLFIQSSALAILALALAACNDSDNSGSASAPYQFGGVFAQAFGAGVDVTREPIAVSPGDITPAVSETADPPRSL